jgi:predicted MFS family arabinose efflux permease
MLVANVAVGRFLRPHTRERLVVPLLVGFGAPLVLLAAPLPLPVVGVVLLFSGALYSYSLGVQRRFLDALDVGHQGHAFALLSTGLMSLQGLGPVVLGMLAEAVSIGVAMVVAGTGPVIAGALWWYADDPGRTRASRREDTQGAGRTVRGRR